MPTKEAINRAAAEAMQIPVFAYPSDPLLPKEYPYIIQFPGNPYQETRFCIWRKSSESEDWNPCADRNLLPLLLAAVKQADVFAEFLCEFRAIVGADPHPDNVQQMRMLTAQTIVWVEAALKALNLWPEEEGEAGK